MTGVRVVFLSADLPPVGAGGVPYQVDLLAAAMVRRGHDVTVVTSIPSGSPSPYRTRVAPPPGGLPRALGAGVGFARADLPACDVIHAHGDDWAVRQRPLVRTFHGSARREARWATTWRRRVGQCAKYTLELASSARATVSVAVSEDTRRCLPGIDHVIANAVGPRWFQAEDVPFERPTVLFVAGRIGGRKRGHLVIGAFRELRRRCPDARLLVVSRDEVDEPGVECHAAVSSDDLAVLFRRSWVLCSASSYEGFGIPYAEALVSGLPVVTTPNTGAAEVLAGGRLGLIVPPEELASAMYRVIDDPALAARLRDEGRAAGRRFDVDDIASQYEAVYREAQYR